MATKIGAESGESRGGKTVIEVGYESTEEAIIFGCSLRRALRSAESNNKKY